MTAGSTEHKNVIVHTPRELGHLVRECRTKRLLTQAQLATAVGVSRKWIIDLEAGKTTADISLVLRTLRALGVELDAKERAERRATQEIDLDAIVEAAGRPKR